MRRRRSPLQLMDDIVDEILLRLPPDDPASLARASAVCRTWRRIVTDAAFSGRYRAFHGGTPPLLGVLRNPRFNFSVSADFIPTTTSFSPTIVGCKKHLHHPILVLDCRHGRVLLYDVSSAELVVWDPITGDQHGLPLIFLMLESPWNAAVVCAAAAGCDHSGCRGGHFRVAVVGKLKDGVPCARVYSSETGAWRAPTTIDQTVDVDGGVPVALVGDALYFPFKFGSGVLRYDMACHALSVIAQPPPYGRGTVLMPAEDGDGGLGFAGVDPNNRLRLGLRKSGPNEGWAAPHRIIDLKEVLPLGVGPMLMGVADDGTYAIFANADDDVFIIDLKSLKARKVCKRERSSRIFPYMTFYTPGPACARDRQISSPVAHGD